MSLIIYHFLPLLTALRAVPPLLGWYTSGGPPRGRSLLKDRDVRTYAKKIPFDFHSRPIRIVGILFQCSEDQQIADFLPETVSNNGGHLRVLITQKRAIRCPSLPPGPCLCPVVICRARAHSRMAPSASVHLLRSLINRRLPKLPHAGTALCSSDSCSVCSRFLL